MICQSLGWSYLFKLPSVLWFSDSSVILLVKLNGGTEKWNGLGFPSHLVASPGPGLHLVFTPAHIAGIAQMQNPLETERCGNFFSLDTIFLFLWYIWFICFPTLPGSCVFRNHSLYKSVLVMSNLVSSFWNLEYTSCLLLNLKIGGQLTGLWPLKLWELWATLVLFKCFYLSVVGIQYISYISFRYII